MATGCAFKRVEPRRQSQLERLVHNAQHSQFTVNYLGSQVVDVGQARRTQAASAGEITSNLRCPPPLFPIGAVIGGGVDQLLSIRP